jgi:hypothetical protein
VGGEGNNERINELKAVPVDLVWHPGLPIYASTAYLKYDGQFGWIGGLNNIGTLRCILPYYVIRKPGFHMIRFRTQTIPWAEELDVAEEKDFLGAVVEHFRSEGADIILPSGNTAIFRTYPDGAAAAPYGTFVNDLDRPEDALFREIRKTYRQNIRKAEAAGVEIRSGMDYLDACYDLVSDTLKRSGSSFKSYDEFKQRVLALGEYVRLYVAVHQGVIQGCMVAPFSYHTAYNCYAGSKPEPVMGAMHLLHWEAIKQFRAMGVKHFDFQGVRINPEKGSKQDGIMNYKKGFGGRAVQGYLWRYPLRPLKSVAYSVAVRLLLGGDIVHQEHTKLVPV